MSAKTPDRTSDRIFGGTFGSRTGTARRMETERRTEMGTEQPKGTGRQTGTGIERRKGTGTERQTGTELQTDFGQQIETARQTGIELQTDFGPQIGSGTGVEVATGTATAARHGCATTTTGRHKIGHHKIGHRKIGRRKMGLHRSLFPLFLQRSRKKSKPQCQKRQNNPRPALLSPRLLSGDVPTSHNAGLTATVTAVRVLSATSGGTARPGGRTGSGCGNRGLPSRRALPAVAAMRLKMQPGTRRGSGRKARRRATMASARRSRWPSARQAQKALGRRHGHHGVGRVPDGRRSARPPDQPTRRVS